ncbi:MAG TPA: hypothetical protein PLV92_03950, partial [Pirellulaceae bacterium]|nr:hypothetical protein [Pirellulaceae bacterium]
MKLRGRATIALVLIAMAIAASGPLCERAAAIDETFADRKAQFEKLTPTQLADLGRKYERFQQLAPDKQHDLRKIHDGLTREGEGERLRGVLDRYHAWLQTLPAGQR